MYVCVPVCVCVVSTPCCARGVGLALWRRDRPTRPRRDRGTSCTCQVRARWLAPVSVGRFLLLLPLRSWPPLPWRLQPVDIHSVYVAAVVERRRRHTVGEPGLLLAACACSLARLLGTSSSSQSPPNRCKLKIRTTTATATTTTDPAPSC